MSDPKSIRLNKSETIESKDWFLKVVKTRPVARRKLTRLHWTKLAKLSQKLIKAKR